LRLASIERASPDAFLADNCLVPVCGHSSVDLPDSPDVGASLFEVLGVTGLQSQSSCADWSFDEGCPKSCFLHRGLHGGLFHVFYMNRPGRHGYRRQKLPLGRQEWPPGQRPARTRVREARPNPYPVPTSATANLHLAVGTDYGAPVTASAPPPANFGSTRGGFCRPRTLLAEAAARTHLLQSYPCDSFGPRTPHELASHSATSSFEITKSGTTIWRPRNGSGF